MRELPAPLTPPPPAHSIHGHSPPLTSPTPTSCEGHSCRWRPYSGTGDFEANAAMILVILLCALICALALNTAIRCFLRGQRPQQQQQQQQQQHQSMTGVGHHEPQQKGNAAALPALVLYSAGLKAKLAGAETAAECAICLSEFEEGQGIRVMGRILFNEEPKISV
ncbi:hypothetical protein L484_019876 [Morus notabilis]|uniref:RING-type E3 ubiquitin transferase n=1 Tax=Morus notabilis TaxID=981085 RepID=W9SHV1_9ROSA|nr:hypothetical protein L484_019876 [Morus notabilis]